MARKQEQWKDMLRQMKLENIQKTTPAAFIASGGFSMETKPYTDRTSNGLTRSIVDFLTFRGHYANRISTQGQARVKEIPRYSLISGEVTITHKVNWTKSSTKKGTPDADAIINGRPVKIEVKIGQDTMSGEQLREKLKIEAAGGLYLVATSFPQFYDWYCRTFANHITEKTI